MAVVKAGGRWLTYQGDQPTGLKGAPGRAPPSQIRTQIIAGDEGVETSLILLERNWFPYTLEKDTGGGTLRLLRMDPRINGGFHRFTIVSR